MDNNLGASKIVSDSNLLKTKILELLDKSSLIAVATGNGGTVGARTVDYVNIGLEIGFFTWNHTKKMADLSKNQNIALCTGNLQVRGKANITPISENNAFQEQYKTKLPDLYEKFTRIDGTCFIIVKPSLFTLMTYEDGNLFLEQLDLLDNSAYRTHLSPW